MWGRDLLSQMSMVIGSPNEAVTLQMFKQGYLPGQGLGKTSSGITQPLQPPINLARKGLGHFL